MMVRAPSRPAPRGGIVLEVRRYGPGEAFAAIWTVDPATHAERIIPVWSDGPLPAIGDEVWWLPGQSPGWCRRGETARTAWLPRVGPSYDPAAAPPKGRP